MGKNEKKHRLEKIILATPITLYLLWQGAEISWAAKGYFTRQQAKIVHTQSMDELRKSDAIREFTSELREKNKNLYDKSKKKDGVVQDSLYWMAKTTIDLDEEEMARHFEKYVSQNKEAWELVKKADIYNSKCEKYGPVSLFLKLVAGR